MPRNKTPLCAAIFASGAGSNAENIARFCAKYPDEIEISALVCDQPNAGVIERIKKYNIPCHVISKNNGDKKHHEESVIHALKPHSIEWVFLAGYMRILSGNFLRHYPRVVNIHPSLLPAFQGKDAPRRAFEAGVPFSGATLHYVDEGIDTGTIIAQEKFPRLKHDTLDDFIARGKEVEYRLYRDFLQALITERKTACPAQSASK